MSIEQATQVVLIASALAFCICLVLGLVALGLRLFTDWKPRDTKLFDWLVKGFLVSIVGGIGSFVVQQFEPSNGNSTSGSDIGPTTSGSPAPRASPVGAEGEPSTPDGDRPAVASQNFPEEVIRWGETNLAPRPFLDRPPGDTYPPCVADLRAADVDTFDKVDVSTKEKASACSPLVQAYNTRVLVNYDKRRERYLDDILEKITDERNEDRYHFMQAEYKNFTDGDNDKAFMALSYVFGCDKDLLINLSRYRLMREKPGCPGVPPSETSAIR
jgi:hypothetical protein